jgi:hypothetical protein
MPRVTLQRVPGRDVAKRVADALRLDPDQRYTVTVTAEDDELAGAASLEHVMDIVGKRARARGLTPELLNNLLKDA